MGIEFEGDVLVNTYNYSSVYWDDLYGFYLCNRVRKLVSRSDVDGIYRLIKDDYTEEDEIKVKKKIMEIIEDLKHSKGVVVIHDELKKDILMSMIEII